MEFYFDLTHRDIEQSYPLFCAIRTTATTIEAIGSKINADTVIPLPKPAATLFASSILDS